MNYIFYLSLALLLPALPSADAHHKPSQQGKLRPRVELTSSAKIAKLISHLKKGEHPDAIDLDYFGGSGERMERITKRSEDRSHLEPARGDSRARLIYVSNPEVLAEYKKKLKKVMAKRGSSAESDANEEKDISYKDILQFLIQVDARLRERDPPANELPFKLTPPKLNNILRNLRRHYDKDSDEIVETRARSRDYDETKERDDYKGHTFSMVKNKPSRSRNKGRVYDSSNEDGRSIKTKKEESSIESSWKKREKSSTEHTWQKTPSAWEKRVPTPERTWNREPDSVFKPRDSWGDVTRFEPKVLVNVDRFRPKPKGRVPNFISTPIPLSGRQGIYEDDK